MAKQNDITGLIRIPEAGYGRFWNFMKTMPGADFTPDIDAKEPNGAAKPKPKRNVGKDADGTSGRCIVLDALVPNGTVMTAGQLNDLMTAQGKSAKTLHGLLHNMVKAKQLKRTDKGYSITAAGRKYYQTECSL